MVALVLCWPSILADTLVWEKAPGGKFSNPTAIRTCDGLIRIMHTWKRTHTPHTCPASGKTLTQ